MVNNTTMLTLSPYNCIAVLTNHRHGNKILYSGTGSADLWGAKKGTYVPYVQDERDLCLNFKY